ncbi:MAG: hypothetical protein AseanaTS_23760 [Candidatus Pelagadaptatus aseana]
MLRIPHITRGPNPPTQKPTFIIKAAGILITMGPLELYQQLPALTTGRSTISVPVNPDLIGQLYPSI